MRSEINLVDDVVFKYLTSEGYLVDIKIQNTCFMVHTRRIKTG